MRLWDVLPAKDALRREVQATTFIERSVVYFGMLVSSFHMNFICELWKIHFPTMTFLLWIELSDFGLSFWSVDLLCYLGT